MAHTPITCPRCGHDHATPIEGCTPAEARQRMLLPFGLVLLVFGWALLYLTLPVLTTMAAGSVNWPMTLIVAAMWPVTGVAAVTIWNTITTRAMAPAYLCDRCGVRWPRGDQSGQPS